jgi:hypothetical protein
MKLRWDWLWDLALQFLTVAAVPMTVVVLIAVSVTTSKPVDVGVDTPGHHATCCVCRPRAPRIAPGETSDVLAQSEDDSIMPTYRHELAATRAKSTRATFVDAYHAR